MAKRLLGARAESAPRSLLSRSPQHQGVFCPDQKSQKLKFQVSFLGLNIALSPNLIGSSDADFYKDSESGLNSKIKKNTKESFVQTTAELQKSFFFSSPVLSKKSLVIVSQFSERSGGSQSLAEGWALLPQQQRP